MPKTESQTVDAALNVRDVCARLKICRTTLDKMINAGLFPQPWRAGRRMLRWHASTVDHWIAAGGTGGTGAEQN